MILCSLCFFVCCFCSLFFVFSSHCAFGLFRSQEQFQIQCSLKAKCVLDLFVIEGYRVFTLFCV